MFCTSEGALGAWNVQLKQRLVWGPRQQAGVVRHTRKWNDAGTSARVHEPFAAEAEARRLYDGIRWYKMASEKAH